MDRAMDTFVAAERQSGRVVWITGLSGSGKTTLAKAVLAAIPQARKVLLDGDELRNALSLLGGGYEYDDRLRLAHTYSRLCKTIAEQGIIVVCATISLFHEVQNWNRRNLPGYVEVFLDASEEILRERDYKRVYVSNKKTGREAGKVMGVQIVPEYPQNSDFHFYQPGLDVNDMAKQIIERVCDKG